MTDEEMTEEEVLREILRRRAERILQVAIPHELTEDQLFEVQASAEFTSELADKEIERREAAGVAD